MDARVRLSALALAEQADRCDFFANASGGTCSQLCAERGGDTLTPPDG